MANNSLPEAQRALIQFLLHQIGIKNGGTASFDLTPYRNLLPRGMPQPEATGLRQIMTALDSEAEMGVAQPAHALTSAAVYVMRAPQQSAMPADIFQGISLREFDPARYFERWDALGKRAALSLPASTGERGVSLYHEFKFLSALVHASYGDAGRLSDGFTLVSGDFPGIQRIIYTIASEGAAKGVRGRSFFLQLLAECVVRRLLEICADMPMTNALQIVGGNFLLLLPASMAERVQAETAQINAKLLDYFLGDIALVTATLDVSAGEVMDASALDTLKAGERAAKLAPFADLALAGGAGWEKLFAPVGKGHPVTCDICQREPVHEHDFAETAGLADGDAWRCSECRAFRDLADDLARVAKNQAGYLSFTQRPVIGNYYVQILHDLCGWACEVAHHPRNGAVNLKLGRADFDFRSEDGFRFAALHTPLTSAQDVAGWEGKYPDASPEEFNQRPREGSVRDFEMLATRGYASVGLARLGVLRMDVDDLGTIFHDRLFPRTLTRSITASDALSLFFEGLIPELCQAVEQDTRRSNSLYLIYGGGDDLFVVGEWDLIPLLAERIHDAFAEFTSGQHSISAGIFLAPVKYPFYRAADQALEALEDAKNRARYGGKNAVSFLGARMEWDSAGIWHTIRAMKDNLVQIAASVQRESIIQNVLTIYSVWAKEYRRRIREQADRRGTRGEARAADAIFYGRYLWLAAYQMTRLAQDNPQVKEDIEKLQEQLLTPQLIRYSGVAARWAELERRSQKGDEA